MQAWCRKSASKHIAHNSKNVLCRLAVKSLCVAGLRVAQDAMHRHACLVHHGRQGFCAHRDGAIISTHTILSRDVAQGVFTKTVHSYQTYPS